jgi:hypothetical protein
MRVETGIRQDGWVVWLLSTGATWWYTITVDSLADGVTPAAVAALEATGPFPTPDAARAAAARDVAARGRHAGSPAGDDGQAPERD